MSDLALMRAALLEEHNAPFRLAAIARPAPNKGEVLVRIVASGVNPLDTKIHSGDAPHARQPLPAVLGLDLAGRVEQVGPDVVGFNVGDEVFGMTGGVGGHQGSLAEYAAVDAALLAAKPTNLSMREAASLPLVAITAWEGLVDRAQVSAGQQVLVHGGAGGIGQLAIQIARAFEAEVFATGSATNRAVIERFGAIFIDYRNELPTDYVARHTAGRGFDVIFDTVGGTTLDASFASVRRFGRVVSALGWGAHNLGPLSFRAGTYSGVFTLLPLLTGEGREHHGEILRNVRGLVERGLIEPNLDPRRYALDAICEAHNAIRSGKSRGKLVIDIEAASSEVAEGAGKCERTSDPPPPALHARRDDIDA